MKIGITQYAAQPDGKMDTRVFQKLSFLCITGIEPFFAAENDAIYAYTDDDFHRLLHQARQYHLTVPSTALGIFNNDPCLIETSGKAKAVAIIKRSLEITHALDASVMLLCTYIKSHPDTPEKKQNLLTVLREAEPIAQKLGIRLALESPLPASELLQILEMEQLPRLGIYYDLGNAIDLGFDPIAEIHQLNRHILSVHVKDSINKLGGLHLGQGHLNLSAALDALKRIGYHGWLILETPGETDDVFLQKNLEILKRYL